MAFVNDYVAEIVLGVVFGQKGSITVFGVDAEGLVGGDDDASVLFGLVGGHGGGFVAKFLSESSQRLVTEFVTVAEEESTSELSSIGDLLEEMDGDAGFTGAGG